MLRSILRPIFRLDIDNALPIGLLATGSLWLAAAAPAAGVSFLVAFLWVAALLALVSGLARASHHYRPDAPARARPGPLRRLVYWAGAAALLTAAAALFHAGHTTLGTVVTVHLLGRLADGLFATGPFPPRDDDLATPDGRRSLIRFEYAAIAFLGVMTAALLWFALGTPPGWAVSLIVTAWWLVLLVAVLTSSLALHASVERPLPGRLSARLFGIGDAAPVSGVLPDTAVNKLLMGLCLLLPVALATAGLAGPAALALLLLMLVRAESAQWELVEAADAGRPAPLGRIARTNHLLMTNIVQLIFSPARHTSNLLGVGAAKEAAELRAAFGRQKGFIYFLWSEPLQRVPYLEQGGLLEPYAEYVVERNWRRDIMDGVDGPAQRSGTRAAERRLLARHDILRKGTPFLVVVPPSGCPRAFRLAGLDMPRWGSGDAYAQTIEFGVLSAIAEAFGPGAGHAG